LVKAYLAKLGNATSRAAKIPTLRVFIPQGVTKSGYAKLTDRRESGPREAVPGHCRAGDLGVSIAAAEERFPSWKNALGAKRASRPALVVFGLSWFDGRVLAFEVGP